MEGLNLVCGFIVGYTTRDVIYRWKANATKPVDIAADMKMSQFDLISTPSGNATDTLKSGEFFMAHCMKQDYQNLFSHAPC